MLLRPDADEGAVGGGEEGRKEKRRASGAAGAKGRYPSFWISSTHFVFDDRSVLVRIGGARWVYLMLFCLCIHQVAPQLDVFPNFSFHF